MSNPFVKLPPTSTSEGIRRLQIQEWMESGLHAVQERSPDIGTVGEIIKRERTSLTGIIEKYCPATARQCEDLGTLQQQVDGLFSLQEKEVGSRDEHRVLRQLRREQRVIATRIRAIFAKRLVAARPSEASNVKKPKVMPIDAINDAWQKVVISRAHTLPIPKDVMQQLAIEQKGNYMAVFKITAAVNILKGIEDLMFDNPEEGFSSLLYLRHFRQSLERIFDRVDRVLLGESNRCESFGTTHRQVYMQALESVEREAMRNYSLHEEAEESTPFVWASDFHKAAREASEECHQLDTSDQQKIDAFHRKPGGQEFARRNEEMMARQREIMHLRGRIDRERYAEFEREMDGWFIEFNAIVTQLAAPHLGRKTANKLRENFQKTMTLTHQTMESLFSAAEEKLAQRSGETVEAADIDSDKRKIPDLQPVISSEILLGIVHRLYALIKEDVDGTNVLQFVQADSQFKKRYYDAFLQCLVDQDLLIQDLPDWIGPREFRDFCDQLRGIFGKLERVMLSKNIGPIKRMYEKYMEHFDRIEREVGELFALQLPQRLPATVSESRGERHESISREEIWNELQTANARADQIIDEAVRKLGGEPLQTHGVFEKILQDAVTQLCPEEVASVADLDRIAYWLIGRIQAIEEVLPNSPANWSNWPKEINRRQFAIALHRICEQLLQKSSTHSEGLLNRPFEIVQTEREDDTSEEINRDDLLKDLVASLQYAEVRLIGTIGKRSKLDKKRKTLHQYFLRVQAALEAYMQKFCPEIIQSPAPLIGIDSFLSEISYCGRFWLLEAGSDSEREWQAMRMKFNEAFVPILEWNEMQVGAQSVDIDSFLDVDVGKIRGGEEEEDAASEDLRSSSALLDNPPEGFAIALAESHLLDADFLWKLMNEGCRTAERTVPETLRIPLANRDGILQLIWRFRKLGFVLADEATEKGPIQTTEAYEKYFSILGKLIDKLEDQYHGKLREFYVAHFRAVRSGIEERICHEHAEKEMQQAVAFLPGRPQTQLQYADLFGRYAHQLFASYCKDFFYSCITPDTSKDEIREVGIAIDTTTELLAADLTERIKTGCEATKSGILTLPELRQCIIDFAAQVDVSCLSVPKGTEEQFRQEVLCRLVETVTSCLHPQEFFQAHFQPQPANAANGAVEREAHSVVKIRDEEELAAMLQSARKDAQQGHQSLFTATDILYAIERTAPSDPALEQFYRASEAICTSLFSEYASPTPDSEEDVHPRLIPLATVLQNIQQSAFNPSDSAKQRASIDALQHLTSILNGLYQSLPRPL